MSVLDYRPTFNLGLILGVFRADISRKRLSICTSMINLAIITCTRCSYQIAAGETIHAMTATARGVDVTPRSKQSDNQTKALKLKIGLFSHQFQAKMETNDGDSRDVRVSFQDSTSKLRFPSVKRSARPLLKRWNLRRGRARKTLDRRPGGISSESSKFQYPHQPSTGTEILVLNGR